MEIKAIKSDGAYTHVSLSGLFDVASASESGELFSKAVVAPGKPAIVDMTECSMLGSAGLNVLLSAAKKLRVCRANLVLYNPQPLVMASLEKAGLSSLIFIECDFAKAMELVSRGHGAKTE